MSILEMSRKEILNNKQQGGVLCFLWKRKSCKEGKCQKMAFRRYDENLKNKFS